RAVDRLTPDIPDPILAVQKQNALRIRSPVILGERNIQPIDWGAAFGRENRDDRRLTLLAITVLTCDVLPVRRHLCSYGDRVGEPARLASVDRHLPKRRTFARDQRREQHRLCVRSTLREEVCLTVR